MDPVLRKYVQEREMATIVALHMRESTMDYFLI